MTGSRGNPVSGVRVAIVHDWLTGMRGGERVLEALLGLIPQAEIFTLVHVSGAVSPRIEERPINQSVIGRMPGAPRVFRYLLPFFPAAVERFDLRGFDLVVSSSHCVAKGVMPPAGAPHLCYCHTPMRYAWEQYDQYFGPGRSSLPVRMAAGGVMRRLRRWDVASADRVTRFVANSKHVRERIRRYYGRPAMVVHPPVDVSRFAAARTQRDRSGYYVTVGALVAYKRIDLAVEAFSGSGRSLIVVGDGPELARLRRRAGPGVTFAGRVSDAELPALVAGAKALVMPGEEDFGIAPVEAQAAGTPVIALARGGALETVVTVEHGGDAATGELFNEPSPDALMTAVERFERITFDPAALRRNAERFGPDTFRERMCAQIEAVLPGAIGAETAPCV